MLNKFNDNMLLVENKEKEYILDLNEQPYGTHVFKVISSDDNGSYLSWGVEFATSPVIDTTIDSRETLRLDLNLEALKKDEYILLRNYAKERFKIVLKPNIEAIRPKNYQFEISDKEIDGRNIRIGILSREGVNEKPWTCSYNGKPLTYDITPYDGTGSAYVDIKLKEDIGCTIQSVIEFTQSKSGKVIELRLMQGNDSVEIIKAD